MTCRQKTQCIDTSHEIVSVADQGRKVPCGKVVVFWVTVIVASSGRRGSGHKKPEAQNMFFDVVIKVLNFIVSVIRVELPKITLHLFFCECRFVDVSCSCRSFSIYNVFLTFLIFFSGNVFNCSLKRIFCRFLFMNWWSGLNYKAHISRNPTLPQGTFLPWSATGVLTLACNVKMNRPKSWGGQAEAMHHQLQMMMLVMLAPNLESTRFQPCQKASS